MFQVFNSHGCIPFGSGGEEWLPVPDAINMTNYLELVKADIPSNRGATGWLCSGGLMVVVVVVPLGVGGR
ncbi:MULTISPECIES: hypothetical protein [Nostocaceae]|uniref:Uncharacterized protein n=1 Tax=Trichormus variabilis N2B TaxID=2681315 RepID=A0ABR6SBX0_ANAVA|nr:MULTISPECIES: hypothetical protein [Nostocaceae]MBC1254980.1 hypothetical protein [Trichormus variabilis V5]MBC1303728.1 hypothetical protein [Trichormus variabilis N2B]MBC1267959.1 hypothetical protein [Trichormus variabilis FSR]MBC1312007.1 hypothetical protein [Trichormus variabilis PNB]MBC1328169.1 hypothetical protein [Trichormus variabilis 9RC]